jgi:hypothetical protein
VLKVLPLTIINEKLYKQGQDQILCQCLHNDEILVILWEMHEGIGGGHFSNKHHSPKGVGCQVLVGNFTQGCIVALSIL